MFVERFVLHLNNIGEYCRLEIFHFHSINKDNIQIQYSYKTQLDGTLLSPSSLLSYFFFKKEVRTKEIKVLNSATRGKEN